jgi:hypothetical protein
MLILNVALTIVWLLLAGQKLGEATRTRNKKHFSSGGLFLLIGLFFFIAAIGKASA